MDLTFVLLMIDIMASHGMHDKAISATSMHSKSITAVLWSDSLSMALLCFFTLEDMSQILILLMVSYASTGFLSNLLPAYSLCIIYHVNEGYL